MQNGAFDVEFLIGRCNPDNTLFTRTTSHFLKAIQRLIALDSFTHLSVFPAAEQ